MRHWLCMLLSPLTERVLRHGGDRMNAGIQSSLRAHRCLLLASVFAVPLICNTAHAVTIEVPADAITDPTLTFFYDFSELNGTALAGQSMTVDFHFALPISVQDLNRDDNINTGIQFTVALFLDNPQSLGGRPDPSGFLFDETGPLLPVIVSRGLGGRADGLEISYFLMFGPEDLIDGILIPGLHFEFTLPVAEGDTQVVRARLLVANPTPHD